MKATRFPLGVAATLLAGLGLVLAPRPADASHPLLKAPYVLFPGVPTEMLVLWQLDSTLSCTIEWGPDTTCSLGSAQTTEYGDDHQHAFTFTGLAPSSRTYYRVTASEDVATGSFRAAPPADATELKFFAYGDTRSQPAVHDDVAHGMLNALSADEDLRTFVLFAGDFVTDGNNESEWTSELFDPARTYIRTMLANLPYQSCMGNHEGTGVLFRKYFPYPCVSDRYWSFDYGPAHIAVIDQYVAYGPGSAQLAWLEADLAGTTKPWRLLCFHEPGWSAGGHGNNVNVQNWIQPLCEQYGVKFVFAGHNHYYARAVYHAVQHVTTGGGGAPLYTPNPDYPHVVAAAEAYHFCVVEIVGQWLTLTAVAPDGTLIDTVTKSTPVGVEVIASGPRVSSFALSPAFPNPFAERTSIRFLAPGARSASLDVFDVRGRHVRRLLEADPGAGFSVAVWDGADDLGRLVPAGVYLVRLEVDGRSRTTRAVRLR